MSVYVDQLGERGFWTLSTGENLLSCLLFADTQAQTRKMARRLHLPTDRQQEQEGVLCLVLFEDEREPAIRLGAWPLTRDNAAIKMRQIRAVQAFKKAGERVPEKDAGGP